MAQATHDPSRSLALAIAEELMPMVEAAARRAVRSEIDGLLDRHAAMQRALARQIAEDETDALLRFTEKYGWGTDEWRNAVRHSYANQVGELVKILGCSLDAAKLHCAGQRDALFASTTGKAPRLDDWTTETIVRLITITAGR